MFSIGLNLEKIRNKQDVYLHWCVGRSKQNTYLWIILHYSKNKVALVRPEVIHNNCELFVRIHFTQMFHQE